MSRRPLSRPSPLLLVLFSGALGLGATGCDPTGDDDDSAGGDGAVVVAGVGAFDTIQEAVDAAPPCANITIGPGVFDERVQISQCTTIVGAGNDRTFLLGGGSGTIVDIDQVDQPVLLSGFAVIGPGDEAGTIRGIRITDSSDVTLDDLFIGFETDPVTGIDHGNVGVDVSRSTVVVADTHIQRVGFGSEVGGACIQAQTQSDVSVDGSILEGGGSFGIHSTGGQMFLKDTQILATNRSTGAQQFEADGSGIYAQDFSQPVTLENVTISGGSFVAAWMDVPSLTVVGGTFENFAYGVYLPGDTGSAAGRNVSITGATFTDLAQMGVLSVASTNVTGSTFQVVNGLPAPMAGAPHGAIRVVAPGGDVNISSNVITGSGGPDGIRILGNTADGNVATAVVSGNTIEGVIGGNGIQAVQVDEVTIEDNLVSGVDHTWNIDASNPANDGLIVNGFGIACFQVDGCNTARNVVEGAEFGNLVIVNSFFTSEEDTLRGGSWRATQIEQSQGTFTSLLVEDHSGVAMTAIDSTIVLDQSEFTGTARGANFRDFDEMDDPLPEDVLYWSGGDAVESFSQNGSAYLEVTNSTFTDNQDSVIISQDGQLVMTGNELVGNGYEYVDEENGITFSAGSPVFVSRGDSTALVGPLIDGNLIDGTEATWVVRVTGARGATVSNNTICGGTSAGLFFSGNDGGSVVGNWLGGSPAGEATTCTEQPWTYQMYLAGSDIEALTEPVEIIGNQLAHPDAQYGFFISALGDYTISENIVASGSSAGVRANVTLPNGMTSDEDGDGVPLYVGDCDDTDPTVYWSRNTQSGAAEIPGDGLDNDCDGVVDDGLDTSDADGDGVSIADGDCDDTDPAVYPGATEILGNRVDDDCSIFLPPSPSADRPSRWADFDAELPVPNLTMEGNTFSNLGAGIDVDGAIVDLSAGPNGNNPNTFTTLTDAGVVADDWFWSSSTPESAPGSVTIAPGTVFSGVGTDCLVVQGVGTELVAEDVDFVGCGGSGLSMYADGVVTLTDVLIDGPTDAGVEVGLGTVVLDGVEITGADTGIVGQGGIITGTDVIVSASTDDAVRVVTSGTTTGQIALSGGSLTGAFGDGAEVQAGLLTLDGVTISGAGLSGINATGGEVLALDGLITAGAIGVSVGGAAVVDLQGWTIDGTTGVGISQASGTLTLDANSSVVNCGGDGIDTNAGTLDLYDPTISGNGGYGISCEAVVLSNACTFNGGSNASGDLDGCQFCTAL